MRIIPSPHFEKQLEKLPDGLVKRIVTRLNDLAEGKEKLDIKKLKGENDYRLRIGDYRVIFGYSTIVKETGENEIVILLQYIFHRKDAYKKRK